MAVTAKLVKELREMTGAGMMDCKKALTATETDNRVEAFPYILFYIVHRYDDRYTGLHI